MNYKLSKYEMETTIDWNEEEANCSCFTCSKKLQRKLDGFLLKISRYTSARNGRWWCEVHFPQEVGAGCFATYLIGRREGKEGRSRTSQLGEEK